ncbi:hypothetical protein L2E82_09933 [Cichorium intybus]|uniref:Uncharacterized protein n=1 Tax=Cichorium intybus TaxID=13427 RepID=A0ACB9G9I6_CICIN|nr:hypothetical protein L2E82_09933 [Cichorium intybus]
MERRTGTERTGEEQIVRDGDVTISRATATAAPAAGCSGRDDAWLLFVGLRNVFGGETVVGRLINWDLIIKLICSTMPDLKNVQLDVPEDSVEVYNDDMHSLYEEEVPMSDGDD